MRLLALLAIAAPLLAQNFEVASVKRSAPDAEGGARSTGAVPRQQEPGRINYPRVNLKSVIALAYGVAFDQIEGPQWLDDDRYDIIATFPAGASQDQVPAMLQHLLTERFAMTIHQETKARAGLALVIGKEGPKLTKATEKSRPGFSATADSVTFTKATLPAFARTLTLFTGRHVTDETGIQGEYDILVKASMDDIKAGSISGAIQDLGLKLESRTTPAKFVVVDKASKVPTAN